jgi:serine phosphatase RsbU (regulator of sigma subunit)
MLPTDNSSLEPSSRLSAAEAGAAMASAAQSFAATAGLLLFQVQPVGPEMSCEQLHDFFLKDNLKVQSLPVVEAGRPIGLVTRYEVVEKFSRLYFRELHSKNSIRQLMDPEPLVVDKDLPLEDLGRLLSREGSRFLSDGFIITARGRYVGMGTGQALVKELAERKQASLAAALQEASARLLKAQEELLEKQRMQRELALAQEIQAALLPRKVPEIPGYRLQAYYHPAKELGGDYYDFIPLHSGLLGLTVADVSGKGVPGSLGMTMARSALRSQALSGASPAWTLRQANALLLPDLRSGMFVTLFYGVLDPATHRLSCASAGHLPALRTVAGGRPQQLAPRGMALGLGPQEYYKAEDAEIFMAPGEILLLYTDGVTEAMDASGEEYGEERLAESLDRHSATPFGRLLEGLLRDLSAFCGSQPQADDITMLALRRDIF